MRTQKWKSFFVSLDKLFGFLFILFAGITFASILFVEFGSFTWSIYWKIARIFLVVFILMIVSKIIFDWFDYKG
jgi:hypothetical protein